jgi:hypothetical protein
MNCKSLFGSGAGRRLVAGRASRFLCFSLIAVLFAATSGRLFAAALIPADGLWRYLKGTQEASPADASAWRQVGFDDSGWPTGVLPVFYGEPLTGTEVADMRGNYASIYFRKSFRVGSPADVETLTLKVRSDDGFIAWLNGSEVARYNVPDGDLNHGSVAGPALAEPIPTEDYLVHSPGVVLRAGENVLAIHGFNVSLGDSSDFVMEARLEYTSDELPPVVERIIPAPGATVRALSSVEIQFSEPVNGVEAADLLVNGQPASSVSEAAPGQFVFAFVAVPPGAATVSFRANHGITDRASVPHPFAGGSWSFTVNPEAPAPGVQLNEMMTRNDRSIRDEDGDRVDWIEILNSGNETVSLTGWHLTDDPMEPRKWRLPAVSLSARSFLLVYASGKDRTNDTARLHANFRLSSDAGGYLALANPAGDIVSSFADYPVQLPDVSFGRAVGSPSVLGYFSGPTPGAQNAQSGAGFAPPVEFSESSRTYTGTMRLALSTTNVAAVIRYTTDGSMPGEGSTVYTVPIEMSTAVQVRARAFASQLFPGPPRSETFIPLASSVSSFRSDLPVMIIHDFNAGRPPANSDTFAHVQLYEPDTNGVTTLTGLPALASRGVVAARGSSTEGYPKISLKLEFQDEFGFDRDLSPAGLPRESDWVLYAPNNFEPILIHNPFAHQLSRDIGRYSPRTRFVEVYLVQSGLGPVAQANYTGIYVIEEKIKLSNDRVDAPALSPGQNSEPDVTGGYLMKIDRSDPGDGGFSSGRQQVQYVDPKETEIELPERTAQRNYINSYMRSFETALYGANFRDPLAGYESRVHVPSWIDHHMLNVLTFNVDALRLSAYFYKQRGGKLHFGPLWDFDRALNSTDGRDSNPRVWRSTVSDRGTDFFNYPWWDRLFRDPDFFQRYIDRYQELRGSHFSMTNLNRLVDELTSQVRAAQPREQARWGVSPRGGFQGEINSLKNWLQSRTTFMDSQFVQPAVIATPGGPVQRGAQVALNLPAGVTAYYTLDGSDPRAAGSATGDDIAPGATAYSGPIVINRNSRLVVRSRNPNHTALTGANNPPLKSIWSGPVAETFVTDPIPLLITEVMYHAAGDGPLSPYNGEDFEFIELKNTGDAPLTLAGVELSGAVDFTFTATNAVQTIPTGERVVLVENPDAFRLRYGNGPVVAGQFSGSLNNDVGRLILRGPLREPILDFHYFETWAGATDGAGRSLVLNSENMVPQRLTEASSWRASTLDGGSPGAPDPAAGIALRAVIAGGGVTIRFNGTDGTSYQVESADQLSAPTWRALGAATSLGGGVFTFSDTIGGNAKFYRVRLL